MMDADDNENESEKRGAAAVAAAIVDGSAERKLASYVADMEGESSHAAVQAARVFDEVLSLQTPLGAPFIERLTGMLNSPHPRVVQSAQRNLPELASVVPAKVAKHMAKVRDAYENASEDGRDGVVRTFVALCAASVAYQKRVVDVFERAMAEADDKTLCRWAELVLPALKGEPYASVRAVVEDRLPTMARPEAQKIADFLGIKLRVSRG